MHSRCIYHERMDQVEVCGNSITGNFKIATDDNSISHEKCLKIKTIVVERLQA